MSIMYKSINCLVKTKDCDLKSKLRPSGVMDFFQDIAWMHAEDIGVGYEATKNNNLFWIILYEQFEVASRLPKFAEEITVNTWPKKSGKIELEREYEIRDKENNLLVKGISNWALIDCTSRRIARADRMSFDGEFNPNNNYNEKQKRKLNLEELEYTKIYDYKVLYTDIDTNYHMNNTKYMDIIYNMNVINDKPFKHIEIAFINEAYYNDIINVGYYEKDSKHYFIGKCNDKLCFEAVITLED